MSLQYNKVIIAGNLTRDPEVKNTTSGQAVASLGVAVNRKWKNAAGEAQEEATFVDVSLWGKSAESIAKHAVKGSGVLIEGRLKLEEWEDKNGGGKRSKLKVVGESWYFTGSKAADSEPKQDQPPAAKRVVTSSAKVVSEEEIPF